MKELGLLSYASEHSTLHCLCYVKSTFALSQEALNNSVLPSTVFQIARVLWLKGEERIWERPADAKAISIIAK